MKARDFVSVLMAALTGAPVAGEAPASEAVVLVRGGTFDMGTGPDSIPELKRRFGLSFPGAFGEEAPAHSVTVSDFRMDAREVTNARFSRFVKARPEWGQAWKGATHPASKGNHPVVLVTWHAAQAYCRWAGGRLPTEAEWEYAARAGDAREFPWGAAPPTPQRANYSASGRGDTAPVGSYEPNPLGLHDLAGNVWEFLLDAWEPKYRSETQRDPVAGGPIPDEAVRGVAGRRAIRGGSYAGAPANLRTRWRDSHVVTNAVAFVGFRCAYPASR
jgi:formylglycine-generating enzyme required for sulfatase activity